MTNQPVFFTLTLLFGALACGDRRPGAPPASARDSADSTFALVQARGREAMGVDQYTSTHQFEPLPDGGRITLTRDSTDPAGESRIRAHMQEIAAAFKRGDFRLPGFVHDQEVPGTDVMRARRSEITYSAESVTGGGQLRIQSRDSAAITAIHEFLAFQRRDHRAGEHSHQ
ncbi:MAG TPA: hypothetical protein VD930_13280 [Gemmatimonadales bacterium]|nr:hypothetical protein [Gemmatimonadales bacterium]